MKLVNPLKLTPYEKSLYVDSCTLLVGCDDAEPEKSEIFTDISGTWIFAHESFSCEFDIVRTLDGKYAIEPGNLFNISGNSHTSTNSHTLVVNGLKIGGIDLSNEDAYMGFNWLTYKADFTEITSEELVYRQGCLTNPQCPIEALQTTLKIKRKK